MQAQDVRELEINYARGFSHQDVEFLRDLTFLESLVLITYHISDISPIHSLTKLRAIDIGSRGERTPIDFTYFERLEDCGVEWRAGSQSLFGCTTLRRLWLNKYPGKGTDPFRSLVNLEELYIASSPVESLPGFS